MKFYFFIISLLWSAALIAQSPPASEVTKAPYGLFYLSEVPNPDQQETLVEFLKERLQLKTHEDIVLDHSVRRGAVQHLRFQHTVYGKIVLFSGINLHLYEDGTALMQSFLMEGSSEAQVTHPDYPYLLSSATGWHEVDRRLVPLDGSMRYDYADPYGWVLFSESAYLNYKDTTASAKVFAVNPLNSSGASYGGNYVDNGDQSNSALDDELEEVEMYTTFRNDSFFLEHPKFTFKELTGPYYDDHYGSPTDTFWYDRSEPRFEAVNAFYHLTHFHAYLNELGFESLALPVKLDVHALGGSDNSRFNPEFYTIEYGDGGVDDAEDGEVIIHEFIHSLSTTASNPTTTSIQRDAMEEGNCDYLAKSYSRSVNDQHSDQVFSWDGHNEFWYGFDIVNNKHYPESLTNTKDGDRDLWSSVLMCIHDEIGREAADSLVLEHLNYQFASAIMPDMAQVLLHLDTVMFQNRYYWPIKHCLVEKGFLSYSASTSDNPIPEGWKLHNTAAFAAGNGNLRLELKGDFFYEVFNTLGQSVQSGTAKDVLRFKPEEFTVGTYVLLVQTESGAYQLKFLR